ncbi:hypothetical protein MVEN_00890200 [Mycena venus]|uniref:Uncharacterized protein n=1 Tax=Mycena venus TaxID=2733690 RepID=A0A8H6YI50_9AGAR|nr:hypothetical protein MVEN_00890200 [Mycena venus]
MGVDPWVPSTYTGFLATYVTSDNASNNEAFQNTLSLLSSVSATRWGSAHTCELHLQNLQLQLQNKQLGSSVDKVQAKSMIYQLI